ncbi:MAG: hypothetical protein SGI88_14175 [Candidatus Hydrogenedentes bacterium]|nr:hypothetical protein [Candidatus Hydrogenedentota bacterium]
MATLFIAVLTLSASLTSADLAVVSGVVPGERRVCIVNLDSGALRQVSNGPWDGAPAWSPDGNWIAHECLMPEGQTGIRIVGDDGIELRHLTVTEVSCRWPAWSPDGTKLGYAAGAGESWRVWVHDLAANTSVAWGTEALSMMSGVWASDTEIVGVAAVRADDGRTTNLYTVEEKAVSPLVTTWGGGAFVEWSPAPHEGTGSIAYESNDGGDREIFVERPRRGVVDVSNHHAPDWNPVWSPDGAWLAFESLRGGTRGIYKVAPQRTLVYPVAADAASDNWSPAWSPDGDSMAFVSTRGGKPGVYICDADGSNARAVTPPEREDLAPAWRPAQMK